MTHGPPVRNKQRDSSSDDDDSDQLPTPPDGGWGWMVVFGSFMIHIINDGLTYSFGLFYVEFLKYFGEDKGYTAWVASILVGVTLCSGPISSSFVNRYGCRAVTIAGGILSAVCLMASMFAQNVMTLFITVGVGTGMGFGLVYLPAIVSVTMYFEKYRSLATGIAVCGSGLGTFLFAPITEELIGNYGWRGAMLILSAIVLNCIIFGALFRPLEKPKSKKNRKSLIHSTDNELQPLKSKIEITKSSESSDSEMEKQKTVMSRSHSIGYDVRKDSYNQHKTSNNHANGKLSLTVPETRLRMSASQPHIQMQPQKLQDTKHLSTSGTMYRKDILYQGSLLSLSKLNTSVHGSYGSLKRVRTGGDDDNVKICGCIPCSRETSDTFSEMMNFSLFKDVVFIIFTISNFSTSIGFNIPYVYLAAQADELGIEGKDASWLLAAIGISNTVSRIVLGYLSDKPWVNRLLVYNLSLTVCGIATALSIFCLDFPSLMLYSTVYGFTIGAYVGLTSVILVDLLGLDKLTNAFGLLLLFQGIASLVGPPFAGWLYDITGSYNPGFLLAGVTIAGSGVILFFIPPILKYRARKEEKLNSELGCITAL